MAKKVFTEDFKTLDISGFFKLDKDDGSFGKPHLIIAQTTAKKKGDKYSYSAFDIEVDFDAGAVHETGMDISSITPVDTNSKACGYYSELINDNKTLRVFIARSLSKLGYIKIMIMNQYYVVTFTKEFIDGLDREKFIYAARVISTAVAWKLIQTDTPTRPSEQEPIKETKSRVDLSELYSCDIEASNPMLYVYNSLKGRIIDHTSKHKACAIVVLELKECVRHLPVFIHPTIHDIIAMDGYASECEFYVELTPEYDLKMVICMPDSTMDSVAISVLDTAFKVVFKDAEHIDHLFEINEAYKAITPVKIQPIFPKPLENIIGLKYDNYIEQDIVITDTTEDNIRYAVVEMDIPMEAYKAYTREPTMKQVTAYDEASRSCHYASQLLFDGTPELTLRPILRILICMPDENITSIKITVFGVLLKLNITGRLSDDRYADYLKQAAKVTHFNVGRDLTPYTYGVSNIRAIDANVSKLSTLAKCIKAGTSILLRDGRKVDIGNLEPGVELVGGTVESSIMREISEALWGERPEVAEDDTHDSSKKMVTITINPRKLKDLSYLGVFNTIVLKAHELDCDIRLNIDMDTHAIEFAVN